jgi:AcrR family transcriptional regulator
MARSSVADDDHRSTDRGVARRRVFLESALKVFCEQGYQSASVNDVVRLAGGSLATLYAQFGSKDGLFVAVLAECNDRFAASLCPIADVKLPLSEGLQRIGEHYLRAALSPQSRQFFRMICAVSQEFPEAARTCLTVGPNRLAEIVADYLSARAPRDGVAIQNPSAAALSFFALLRGPHQYKAILDERYELSDDELRLHVTESVRFFLHGVGARSHG